MVENQREIDDLASGLFMRPVVDRGDMPFLIKQDGSWLYQGTKMTRKSMVCLFASVLTRDETGAFRLETPAESGRIEVEDSPFIVVGMRWRGAGSHQQISFLTNMDECILLGPEHGLRMGGQSARGVKVPYLHVRDGQGAFPLEARINRATYYELMALAEPGTMQGKDMLGVWSSGLFFPLCTLTEDNLCPA